MLPLLFTFVLEFITRKIWESKERGILNGFNEILVYVVSVFIFAQKYIIQKYLKTTKEVWLDVNIDKTKYMVTSQNCLNVTKKIPISNNKFEAVDYFKY